jgi:hypothetical protein
LQGVASSNIALRGTSGTCCSPQVGWNPASGTPPAGQPGPGPHLVGLGRGAADLAVPMTNATTDQQPPPALPCKCVLMWVVERHTQTLGIPRGVIVSFPRRSSRNHAHPANLLLLPVRNPSESTRAFVDSRRDHTVLNGWYESFVREQLVFSVDTKSSVGVRWRPPVLRNMYQGNTSMQL